MAEKKPDKKGPPKPSGGGGGSADVQMAVIAVVLILFVVGPAVMIFFGFSGNYSAVTDNFTEKISSAFTSFVDTVSFLSIFISLLFVMGIIYAKTRLTETTEAYNARLKALDDIGKPKPLQSYLAMNTPIAASTGAPQTSAQSSQSAPTPSVQPVVTAVPATAQSGPRLSPFEQYMVSKGKPLSESHTAMSAISMNSTAPTATSTSDASSSSQYATNGGFGGASNLNASSQMQTVTNPRWMQIEKNMQSHNMSEWRVAILESDILLYEMLSQMGYDGNSIGEILKNVDKANFVTLDDAWKAHRIRNIIAHEGANYELSRDEAERTIRLFKRVFDEFYFV